MAPYERRALREWVEEGNSPYENASGAWYDGGVPIDFITVFRDEEFIRQNTKGMTPNETRAFALKYFGWDEEPASEPHKYPENFEALLKENS